MIEMSIMKSIAYKQYIVIVRIYDEKNEIVQRMEFPVEAKTFKSASLRARSKFFETGIKKAMFDIRKGNELKCRYIFGIDIPENRKMYLKDLDENKGECGR